MKYDFLVTVIIPVYNCQNEVSKCLTSVLKQSLRSIEIIVVDDGSTDNTLSVVKQIEYENPEKIKVIHTENKGVTSARLTGVENSTGEWIGFVDSDDVIEPDMYEFLISNAITYKADISHCGYQMVFPDGRINYFYNTGRLVEQDRITGMKDLLEGSFIEPGLWNKLFHKTLFHSLLHEDLMDKSIKINEDLLMNYILFSQSNKSVYRDICKYHYIVRNTSASRGNLNLHKIYDPIKVKQYIYGMKIEGLEDISIKVYLNTCINVYNSLMIDKSKQFRKEEIKIRKLIIANRDSIGLLDKKQKILAYFILYFHRLYRFIYNVYFKYLLNNKYE